jgi:hypothetical protein
MKSPWNIIGRLIAGRKPIEETALPVSTDGAPSSGHQSVIDPKPLSPHPDEQLANRGAAHRSGSIDEQPNDATASPLMRAKEPAAPVPDLSAFGKIAGPADEVMNGRRPAGKTSQRQTRRLRRMRLSAASVVKASVDDVSISGSGDEQRTPEFTADVVAVEADVRALRRQLAQKLTVQNAQLRQMLKRFKSI